MPRKSKLFFATHHFAGEGLLKPIRAKSGNDGDPDLRPT